MASARGGHQRRQNGRWPTEMEGYVIHPPSPVVPRREAYALQRLMVFAPDLRHCLSYPSVFVNGVAPCPRCESCSAVTANGFTKGRRVLSLTETYVLIGRKYVCATCRSEEHTSELQSLMRISYAVFCLKTKTIHHK